MQDLGGEEMSFSKIDGNSNDFLLPTLLDKMGNFYGPQNLIKTMLKFKKLF